jgi:hypothetical protein
MAHEYAKEAKALHEKKLKSYGKDDKALGSKDKAKNRAGFDALNTNEQAGMRPLNKPASMSDETNPRIMRKKGGKVVGAQSLKRLDKAPRKGKAVGGQMMGTGQRIGAIPSPQTQQENFDPQLRGRPGETAPGTMRKKGGKVMGGQQDYEARSHESQGSQGLRPREGHRKGGKIQDYEARSDDSQGVSGKPVRHSNAKGGSAYHEGHMSKGQKYGAARTSGETKGELDSAMRALKYGNKKKAEKELGRAQGHTRKTEYYTGRATGGKAEHPDEAEDKALIRKMVKAKDLKMKDGGAAKRKKYEDGGGKLPSPYEAMESAGRLKEIRSKDTREPSESEAAETYNREGANAVHDMEARKQGGRTKKATGGAFSDYMGEDSSSHKSGGKSGKGKTTVNVIIGGNPEQQQPQGPNPMALAALLGAARGGAGGPPQQLPPPGAGPQLPPAMAGGPSAAPAMGGALPAMASGAGAMPPGGPMPRKDGGSVQVPYKKPGRKGEYPAMDFGAGGGFGRKQKIDAYGDQQKK